ncbi:MAG: hypothetical protein FWH29_03580 [Methanobrevibacter sp.]|nr:hypothetical protein [Methanobrevibacter sp.]
MNNFRKISISSILLLMLLVVFSLQATFATDIYVDSSDFGGINGALAIANNTDTIVLANGTYNKINEDFNLTITKNLTIRGDGPPGTVAINGRYLSNIFAINSALNVTFINIVFGNGSQSSMGNGFSNYGGAIYAENTNVIFINCTFGNNTATNYGGAISAVNSNITVIGSTFSYNNVTGNNSFGGAIYNTGDNLTIVNSSFIQNRATSFGGAIYNTGDNPTIIDSILRDNHAINGGGIFNSGEHLNVVTSTFTGNSAREGGSLSNGGGISNSGANLTIENSIFTDNHANTGGAIYNNASSSEANLNFTVDDSTFINNLANTGGAIFCSDDFTSVNNSTFSANNGNVGGGVYSAGDNFTISHSVFDENTAVTGAGVYSAGDNLNVSHSVFDENIAVAGGGIYIEGNDSIISNSNFTNNSQGIGINTLIYTLDNNRLIDNRIAIHYALLNQNYTISNLSSNNYISDNDFAIGFSGSSSNYIIDDSFGLLNNGGFIFMSSATFNTILDSNISGYNRNDSWAIFFQQYSWENSVINSNITNNTNGIGINGSNSIVIGSNITDNNQGIHVLPGSSNAVINYNRILNNTNFNGFDLLNNGSNTNANYNWWGANTPLVSGITLANWFVIVLSANDYKTIVNDTIYHMVSNVELSYEFLLIDSSGDFSLVDDDLLPSFLVNLIWNGTTGTIYNLTNVNGKGKYSYNVTLTGYNSFSLQAIGDNEDIILYLNPDLSDIVNITINKTTNVTSNISYGDNVTYIITVTNNGPSNVTDVMVVDVLDPRLIYIISSDYGDYNLATRTVTWNLSFIGTGNSVILTITVRVNGTGNISNIANVTTNQDNHGDNSSDSVNFTVPNIVNLTITKNHNVTGSVTVGDHVLYTIVITNNGPDIATGVIVSDVLDSRLIYIESSENSSFDPVTRTVSWIVGSIGVGSNVTLTLIVRVNGTGNIFNFASVDVNETNIGNNSTEGNDINFTVEPTVNLSITKSNNLTPGEVVNVGDLVTYVITVSNWGPDNATNVVVTDILDPRLIFESSTGGYNHTTGLWIIGNLNMGDTISLNITVRVNGTGNIANIANVTVDQNNMGNNTTEGNSSNFTVDSAVNLSITKVNNLSPDAVVSVGDLVTYVIIVSNWGPDNATNVVVTDILDSRLIFESSTGDYNHTTGLWIIGNLNVGDTISLNITVRVNGTGNIANIANVSVDQTNLGNNTTDGNGSNFTVDSAVNLSITKVNNLTPDAVVSVGDLVTYVITVINWGPDNAINVVVTDILDPRLIFESSTGDYNHTTGLWIIGNLNVGDTISLNITVRVNGTGNIANIANVSVDQNNMGNNTTEEDCSNFTVNSTVNFTITKVHNVSGSVVVGDQVLYTIIVTNYGPDVATGVVVSDVLDSRLVYIESNASGVFDPVTRTVSWIVGSIGVGDSVTLTVTVQLNGTGSILNLANVTVNEENIGNNSTEFDDNNSTLDLNDTVNLTITKAHNVTDSAVVGDQVLYTIVVTNNGPDIATGVVVWDVLDPRLIYIDSNASGVFNSVTRTVSWIVGTISVGESVTLTITVQLNGTGRILNFANVTVDELNIGENNTEFEEEESVLDLTNTVNLTITKYHNVTGSVAVGDQVLYTIVVTNHGPDIATGGLVCDELDPRLIYIDCSVGGTFDPLTRTIYWIVGYIGIGDNVTLTVIVQVNGTGNIINFANITVDEINIGENGTEYDEENSTLDLNNTVNLTIIKYHNVTGSVTVGEHVLYTIVVTNHGPDVATGVVISDVLDYRLIYIDSSVSGVYDSVTRTVSWIVGSIGIGENITLTVTVQVNGTGNILNIANVTVNELNIGENSTNENDSNLSLPNTVNFTITKNHNVTDSVTVGDHVVYTIVVTNHGPDVATGVVVVDVLDPRLIYLISNVGGFYNVASRTVSWDVGIMGIGESRNLVVTVIVNGSGDIINLANVSVNELNIGENSTNGSNHFLRLPDTVNLTITKNVNVTGSVIIGDHVLYTIVVTNHGPDIATGLVVVDVLDPRLVYVISNAGGTYNPLTRTVSWVVGSIGIGENVTLTLTAKVNGSGNIFNLVNVTVNEVNVGENHSEENGTVFDAFKLEINSSIIVPLSSKFGDTISINGTLIDEKGDPVANVNISILVDGQSFTVFTNSLGEWVLSYTPYNVGNLSIVLSWIGNDIYHSFINSSTLNVLKLETNIVVEDVPLRLNFTSNLTAYLKDENGNPVTGATIDFYINGTYVGSNLTDGNGKVVLSYTPNNTGLLNISLQYNGSNTYESSNDSIIQEVTIMATKIIIDSVSTKPFTNTTIPITLLDEFGNYISNENIIVIINGEEYNLTTNSYGKAFLYYIPSTAGDLSINAYFNQTDIYLNSSSVGVLVVEKINTSISLKNVFINTLENASFTATLVDEYGNLLTNMIIEVFIDGLSIGEFITDAHGRIFIGHSSLSQGTYTINAVFYGDNIYTATNANSILTVRPVQTSLTVSVVQSENSSTSFVARLVDEFNNSLANQLIVFTLNGQFIGIAITDSNGIAVLNYSFIPEGRIIAEFIGNNLYRESIDSHIFTINISPIDSNKNLPNFYDEDISISNDTNSSKPDNENYDNDNLDLDILDPHHTDFDGLDRSSPSSIPMLNTANPIAILVLSLLSMLLIGFWRKLKI